MSECPNCGSARDDYGTFQCGTNKYHLDHPSERCQLQAAEALIRSLREELAEARDANTKAITKFAEYAEQLAGARDAERDRIADWLSDKSLSTDAMTLKGGDTQANARLRAIAWQQAKDAVQIRNNEHRSNT